MSVQWTLTIIFNWAKVILTDSSGIILVYLFRIWGGRWVNFRFWVSFLYSRGYFQQNFYIKVSWFSLWVSNFSFYLKKFISKGCVIIVKVESQSSLYEAGRTKPRIWASHYNNFSWTFPKLYFFSSAASVDVIVLLFYGLLVLLF